MVPGYALIISFESSTALGRWITSSLPEPTRA